MRPAATLLVRLLFVFLALALSASGAHAQSAVGRSLLLPAGDLEPFGLVGFVQPGNGAENLEYLAVGLGVGVTSRTEIGMWADFAASPAVDDLLLFDLRQELNRSVALRLDVGLERLDYAPPADYELVGGAGLSIKLRLNGSLALISGRPFPWSFANDPDFLDDSDDWLAFRAGPGGGMTFGLPIGLLAQVSHDVALDVRTGYRATLGGEPRGGEWVPFGVDLWLTLAETVDLGLSYDLPGETSDYLARRIFLLWLAARF